MQSDFPLEDIGVARRTCTAADARNLAAANRDPSLHDPFTSSTFSTMFFGTSSVSRKFVLVKVRSLPSAFGYGSQDAKGGTQDLLRSINFDVLSSIPP